jgi:hypothetical protein
MLKTKSVDVNVYDTEGDTAIFDVIDSQFMTYVQIYDVVKRILYR